MVFAATRMVAESWFRSLWKVPPKHESGQGNEEIGVLAFEVASLMSKVVHLWQSLSDKQVARLREEISSSVGIKKLVSEDDECIVSLVYAEIIDGMIHIAKSVARLSKKCSDPSLKSFESAFDELMKIGADPYGWVLTWKKMDKKVKKMERLFSSNASLYQELELLSDLEQTVRRMKGSNPEPDNIAEYQKKLLWKQQEVKHLKDSSLWNKTYNYVINLLVRSLFTLFARSNYVFGMDQMDFPGDSQIPDFIYRSQSVSTILQSSVHPSENGSLPQFSSGPLGRFTPKSGPIANLSKTNNFYSGPLGASVTKSGPAKNRNTNFFSGPLNRPSTKSGTVTGIKKFGKRMWHIPLPTSHAKKTQSKQHNPSTLVDSSKAHPFAAKGSSILNSSGTSILSSRHKLLEAQPETLGAVALALHYANVIIVIEKLGASPHLIGHDAREDLYTMLPGNIRTLLREKLKPYTKSLASSVYDTVLAAEWTKAITSILEWLAPLAHNMIRWQSERSFEQQNLVSRTNVLLVQTLYFANQEKTEATITELLVGLNYLWRFGRELNEKALRECASSRMFDEYLEIAK